MARDMIAVLNLGSRENERLLAARTAAAAQILPGLALESWISCPI